MDDDNIHIELVPIEKIAVLNPLGRNRRVHRDIIDSIEQVGLKRPIGAVSPTATCLYAAQVGQGRPVSRP